MSHRTVLAVGVSLGLVAVAVGAWFANRPAQPLLVVLPTNDEPPPSTDTPLPAHQPLLREDIERDLKLVGELYQTDVSAGDDVWFRKLELLNTSKTATYRVVKEGDGSAEGRREPYVYFTGESQTPGGKWEPEEREQWGVCGVFDWNWQKDVIELKPGESLPIDGGPTHFRFQHNGTARITAHYQYLSRPEGMVSRQDTNRGAMGDCPAFHVTSTPIELTVRRPLDVKVHAKRKLKAGEAVNLSDVIEVTATNTTANPIELTELGSNMSCGSGLVIRSAWVERVELSGYRQVYGQKLSLAAGKSVALFGAGDFTNSADAKVTAKKPGKYKLTVLYYPQTNNGGSIGPTLTAETVIVVEP